LSPTFINEDGKQRRDDISMIKYLFIQVCYVYVAFHFGEKMGKITITIKITIRPITKDDTNSQDVK